MHPSPNPMSEDKLDKTSPSDAVHPVETESVGEMHHHELRREFKPRQVAMFSIACAIGTGLVIGSGTALSRGGPGSLLIAYIIIGITVFFVMTGLGEMAAFLPMSKGFGGYATRMVDPAFGFTTGWNYVFKYIIATPTNLTASGLIMQYWLPHVNVGVWITVFGILIIAINFFHVSNLGETEFILGCIKVTIMVILIITCLVVSLGGGPNHDRVGFRYWEHPGAFAKYLAKGSTGTFLGWWACMCQACFAYTGTEVVGMTFGETPNPRKNIPRAVKQTFWRIACFYVVGVLVLGMAVPYTSDLLVGATKAKTSAAASPFVVAMRIAGIKILPDIVNGGLLIFVLSAACTDIYCASRSLYGLARDAQAPAFLARTTDKGVPYFAVGCTSLFVLLGYLNVAKSAAQVFGYFVSLVTVFAVLNWIALLVSHISFRRALKRQDIPLRVLPYVGFLQPYGSYFALVVSCVVVVFQGYDAFIPHFKVDTFVLKYLGVVLFLLNITFWKLWKRTSRVKAGDVDLVTGRRDFDGVEEEEESQKERKWTPFLRV